MKRIHVAAVAGLLGLAACSDSRTAPLAGPDFSFGLAGTVRVRNSNATGPGSFHQAIEVANASPAIAKVAFDRRLGTIALTAPIVYTGSQDLAIDGNHAALDGAALAAGVAGFTATGGGDLDLRALTVRRAPGPGVVVAVPAGSSGTIHITLVGLTVTGSGSHGVLINDQAEYFLDPNSTSTDGSAASLDVRVFGSSFSQNGFTALDQDGLRINEGGAGSLRAVVSGTRVEGNGGDGVEFDERDVGDVSFTVFASALDGNGSFDAADFDDGIDVDEGGDGSIVGNVVLTSANENFEQGFDLNENGAGDLRVDMTLVEAIDNHQEGIEYEEDDDVAGGGDIVARLTAVTTRGNGVDDGDAGLKLREKGVGNLDVRLAGIESAGNFVDGVLLREDADGDLTGSIRFATTNGNTGDGIEFDENGGGNLTGSVERATASTNTQAGFRADQAGAGVGTLQLINVTTVGNIVAAIVANAGVTVTQTP